MQKTKMAVFMVAIIGSVSFYLLLQQHLYRSLYKESSNKNAKHPVILYYEQHPEQFFTTFNLSGICPYYCIFTGNRSLYNNSKAVIFFRTLSTIPPKKGENQLWIYFTFEPPTQIWLPKKGNPWQKSLNMFDWIMSYRPNSEILVPFGRLTQIPATKQVDLNYSLIYLNKDREVAWVVSHCITDSRREMYVKELQKYIPVDVFGQCGAKLKENKKSGQEKALYLTKIKDIISKRYKFYLAFENSLCTHYTSEKLYGIYTSDNLMIPVARGDPNISQSLPEGTFISTYNFSSPRDLAQYLKYVGSSEKRYISYLKEKLKYTSDMWTDNYVTGICHLCEKLQSNINVNTNIGMNLYHRLTEDRCFKPNDIK